MAPDFRTQLQPILTTKRNAACSHCYSINCRRWLFRSHVL